MVNNINNFGVINFFENNNSQSKREQPKQVQDIIPEPENEPSQKPKGLFPRITKAAYDAGKAQQVDDELRSASVSAPKLIKAINFNEAMNYLDTKNMNTNELYDMLNEYYDLPFKPRCFRYYRSK